MAGFSRFGQLDDAVAVDGDRAFLRVNARLEPHQLQPGELALSENGRMDRGVWQPRKGIENISGSLQEGNQPLKLPFFLLPAGGISITSATRSGTTVTLTVTHGLTTSAVGFVVISGLAGTFDPNGVYSVTVVNSSTLTYTLTGATGSETYTGSGKIESKLNDSGAFGSCLFSDPSSENAEFIIVATSGQAFKISLADGTTEPVRYPNGVNILSSVDMIQAFDRVFLFRDGEQALEWRTPLGRVATAAALASNVVTVTLPDHGLTIGDSVTVSGVDFSGTDPNGARTVTAIPTSDTFSFALTGADETYTVDSDSKVVAGFTKVRAGAYTQPQVFEVTGTNVAVSSGLVTLTISGNTTVKVGDTITLYASDDPSFTSFVGRSFIVTSASATEVKFYATVEDLSTIGSNVLSFGKDVSVGGGFQHMPAPPWGVYHQRRLITPYRYSQTGTTASPTFTDRNVRDEIVFSDILDPDTYDAIANQFRVTAGIADFTVAVEPFYQDTLLVFNRNSIHGVFGVSGSLADASVRELTREIGCLARKSLAQHGAQVMFLSDDGVYSITFIDEYNLRGADNPLSEAIQPTIDRINRSLAANAVGIYFANRYYLAVPLDSSEGAADATGNNSLLVYNFQNQGWESVDTVDATGWNIIDLHVGRSGDRNDLYAVNDLGGTHKIDSVATGIDDLAITAGGANTEAAVQGKMTTRKYDFGTMERKRFSRLQLNLEGIGQVTDGQISITTEEPDSSLELGRLSSFQSYGFPSDGGVSVRTRIGGRRGNGLQFTFESVTGRPRLKSLTIDATVTNRATTTQV